MNKLANRLLWLLAGAGGIAIYFARRSAQYEVAYENAVDDLESANEELESADNTISAMVNELQGRLGGGATISLIVPTGPSPVTTLPPDKAQDDGGDVDKFVTVMEKEGGDSERDN